MRRIKLVLGLSANLLAAGLFTYAQTPAFPGALGFGAYATGGRNGTVYHVTNRNDSGPGSFRDAVSSSGRTIVFDVGGHVQLLTAVSAKGNLTIAGQTAPGGICFDGGEISFAGRANIICRYIRVRPGSTTASTGDDCISLYQATNAILDHVSLAFGPWNNIDAVTANNISVQHCIDANPIYQQFGAHTENVGAFWSWQYNLFANSHNRNPLAKINTVFINNLEYNNSAGYTTHTSTRFKHDIVNNYFVAGPASGGNFPWYQIDSNQSIYYTGNLYDANKDGALNGAITTPYWYQGVGTILSAPWSSWTTVIPTMSADLAYRYDVSADGAWPRDDVDSLIISQVKTLGSGTTGTGPGTAGPDGGLYTSQTQTGLGNNGYGSITGGSAPANFSGDGIADYWKLANGLNTNTVYPLTNTVTGYTLLENYLNFLAAPHAVTQTNTPASINLAQFTSGFSASATFSLTNATNGTVTLSNGTNANFVPASNFSGLGTFTFIVAESGLSLSAQVTVCITPVTPPASAVNFNGALMLAATNATSSVIAPPSNLTWRGDGAANVWSTTAPNWLNGASLAAFKNSDVVTFDDTGSNTPAINLTTTLTPGAIFFSDTRNYALSGNGSLSGSGSFSKTGTGTVQISTTNSLLSGAINIRDGMVTLVSGTTLGSGSITLAGGGTFEVQGGGGGSTITGAIKVSPGENVTLSSGQLATSFNGAVTTSSTNSVLNVSNSVSFGGIPASQFSGFYGTIQIQPGSTLRFAANTNGATFGSLNPSFVVSGTMRPRLAGSTILLGSVSGSGILTGQEKPATNGGVGNVIYNIGGNNTDSTFFGIINDALINTNPSCLLKSGAGRLTLTGANTFTGTNTVAAGTLVINGSATPALTTVYAGATLAGTGTITGPVTVQSGGILSPGPQGGGSIGTLTILGHLTNTSSVLNFDLSASPSGANDRISLLGTLAMSGAQTFNFNLTGNALGAGTYGLIEGATNSTQSAVSFASNLPGNTRQNISFSAAAPGSNPSFVRLAVAGAAGALVWSGTNGSAWDTSTINWRNGAGADQFYNLDAVTFNDSSTNGTVTLSGALQPGSVLVSNSALAYAFGGPGALSGSGTLTIAGPGTLSINTANNAYTGNISVAGGTLSAGAGSSLGTGAMSISGGGTFSLPFASPAVAYGGTITVLASQAGTISSGSLGNSLSGNLVSGNNASTLNLASGVAFSGTNSAQFDNYTGTVNIPSGATLLFSGGTGNTLSSANPVFIINGTLQPLNAGNTIQLGAFSGSGAIAGPQTNSGAGDTLYVIGGNDTSATFGGVISSNSAVAGSQVIVNKIGAGTLTLSGGSTFTGGTTVSGGTLSISNTGGTATGTGDLEIFSGATLTGRGIIASATTVDNGATLAPGNPSGTLTISNSLTLNDNSILQFGLGTNSDSVLVSGDLALTGLLTVTNSGGFGAGSYTLFTCGGAVSFGNLQLVAAPSGFNYSFDTNTPGVIKLVAAPLTPPIIGGPSVIGGKFVFSGSGGTPGATYYVVTTTNLATPAFNWIPILTNQFDTNGDFAVTNGPATNARSFYRLQLQ